MVIIFLISIYTAVHFYINREVPLRLIKQDEAYVYYFAYGSNMTTRYLSNVRNINSYESYGALVNDYEVTFSLKGIEYIEPAFANLTFSGKGKAYGVIHFIEKSDLKKIINSESSDYQMKKVFVDIIGENKKLSAWTLVGSENDFQSVPSVRYLEIIKEGAREHGLPKECMVTLEKIQGAYIPVVSEIIGTLIYIMVIVKSY